jgi:hypothetical protein
LICVSTIGIIFSIYASDNIFEAIFGKTYALKLIPEAEIISSSFTEDSSYSGKSFIISVGYIIVLFVTLLLYNFDFEKHLHF